MSHSPPSTCWRHCWQTQTDNRFQLLRRDQKSTPCSRVRFLSRSLFHHLCSSGLVTEVGHYDHNTKITDVRVRFAYERFSDYFIAQRLLTGAKTFSQLRKDWQKGGLIEWWKTYRGYYTHRGLLTALAVLLPEKFKVEMAEVIAGRDVQQPVLEDFPRVITLEKSGEHHS